MTRYRCSACEGLPLLWRRNRRGRAVCLRCGASLRRLSPLGVGHGVALGAAALALGLAAAPDLFDRMASLAVSTSGLPRLLETFDPPPEPHVQPLALLQAGLLERLAEGDRRWLPTAEPLQGGGTRYLYQRRPGEPELSLAQIRSLMAAPPTHAAERQAILDLLRTLQVAGVRLELSQPRKSGAAAEWDHAARTLRIQPGVPEKGTVDFARVLNHEAIHVAQSCNAGFLRARPKRLGLPTRLAPELAAQLNDPVYAEASVWERTLEEEAYANQHQLALGPLLVRTHCRSRSGG